MRIKIIIIILSFLSICSLNKQGNIEMKDIFYKNYSDKLLFNFPYIEIQKIKRDSEIFKAEKVLVHEENKEYYKPFSNFSSNSSVGFSLEYGNWEIFWKSACPEFSEVQYVLDAKRFIVVQGTTQWQLVDKMSGDEILRSNKGDSDIIIDNLNSQLFYINNIGYIVNHNISGEIKHKCPVYFLDKCKRLMIRYKNKSYYVASKSYGPPPLGNGNMWSFEKVEFINDTNVDVFQVLKEVHDAGRIIQKNNELCTPASYFDTTILVIRNKFFIIDENMQIQKALISEFNPIYFSISKEGDIYAAIINEANLFLWRLDQLGGLYFSINLSAKLNDIIMPPIIGFDKKIYCLSKDRILTFNSEGDILWNQHAGGPITGAIVTADDQLLVSAGNFIAAFNDKGERRILYVFPSEKLCTPPILTADNLMFVASQNNLYCLRIKSN